MLPSSLVELQKDINGLSTSVANVSNRVTTVNTNLTNHQSNNSAHPTISVANSTKWDAAKKIVSSSAPSAAVGEVGDIYFQTI